MNDASLPPSAGTMKLLLDPWPKWGKTISKPSAELRDGFDNIKKQLSRVIVGQDEVIEELLIALFSRGHCILEGVPGLAKTLMISTLSQVAVAGLQPHPVHPRPDAVRHHRHRGHRGEPLAPASASSSSSQGPLFANVILADEINRTPPKTQAALLEAMQERQVTVGRVRHRLDDPFFVLATQNPIEQEGTYPLPEAQQDRFMFKVFVRYPKFDEEFEIARRTTSLPIEEIYAGAERRADPGVAEPGAQGAGQRSRHPLHAGPGAADAHRRTGRAEVHPRMAVLGRRPSCRADTSSSAARRGPCSMAASTSRPRTSRRWPIRCCGTASSPTSPPLRKASRPTRSSRS